MTTDREAHDTFKGLRLKNPRWSRADYEACAAVLKSGFENGLVAPEFSGRAYAAAYLDLATRYADMFAEDNPAFKRDLFLKACGVLQ